MNTPFCDTRKSPTFSKMYQHWHGVPNSLDCQGTSERPCMHQTGLLGSSQQYRFVGYQSQTRRSRNGGHEAATETTSKIQMNSSQGKLNTITFYTDSRSYRFKRREFRTSNEAANATLQAPEFWTNQRRTHGRTTCRTTSGPGPATALFLEPQAAILV